MISEKTKAPSQKEAETMNFSSRLDRYVIARGIVSFNLLYACRIPRVLSKSYAIVCQFYVCMLQECNNSLLGQMTFLM
jgi:hypothetical protein